MPELSVDTVNLDRLKNAVKPEMYEQGLNLYRRGRVTVQEVSDMVALCVVHDMRTFDTEIRLSGNYLYLKCACSYGNRGLICEHEVASAMAVNEYLRHNQPHSHKWKAQLSQALQAAKAGSKRSANHPYYLFFSLQKVPAGYYSSWRISPYQLPLNKLPQAPGEDKAPLLEKDLEKLIETTPNLASLVKSPYNSIKPTGCINCPPESVVLANILLERSRAYTYYYTAFPLTDYLSLLSSTNSPLFLGSPENPLKKGLQILPDSGGLQLEVTKSETGLRLLAKIAFGEHVLSLKEGDIEVISSSPFWVLADRYLFQVENTAKAEFLTFWIENREILVPARDETEFLEKFYLNLAEQIPLLGESISKELVQAEPVRRLYLSDTNGVLQASLRFGYADYEVPFDARLPSESLVRKPDSWTLMQIRRQPIDEEEAFRLLSTSSFGLKRAPTPAKPGVFVLRSRTHPVDFLLHTVPRLAKEGFEIYGEEQLKTARVNRNQATLSFNVSSGIDWFDVKVGINFGELEVSLKDVRRALRKKERYVKLADGTIGEIPEEWIERYKHLFGLGEETQNGVRLSSAHLGLIDELLAGSSRARTDPEFERRRQRLRDFSSIHTIDLPRDFSGELRPYQKAGFDWLHFLHEFEFGGCLADDMGLGKTVQVLVFLQSLKEGSGNGKTPRAANLVVVPRSLLVNWQREAARFTPNLRLLEYFESNREKDVSTFDQYDLVITTYGIMLRDIASLRKYTFNYVLLDESQAIKNPFSLTAKAARQLRARHRLVLTGTPVENSTIELWSQFAFLNPGLLGNLEYFKTEFSSPIERKGDENSAQFLRKMVYPFILRRTKDQVAPELPPRSERILYSDMEPAQRKMYNRTRDVYRGLLLGMIEKEGIGNTRMKILEGLLRLRQISNHPRLVDEKFRGESGKFELLLETLETLASEGHKALVFSQFVQMLRLVRTALDGREIPYAYLDGHTRDRQDRVDLFQSDPKIPFFLISLKAGGTGLNLTAADYVIHIDPWWNPAVEMQASDRTHRIGQDKPVFVYKLITRDSVEEKILQLQERKKSLVDQLIATETNFFKNLSAEDVAVLFS